MGMVILDLVILRTIMGINRINPIIISVVGKGLVIIDIFNPITENESESESIPSITESIPGIIVVRVLVRVIVVRILLDGMANENLL